MERISEFVKLLQLVLYFKKMVLRSFFSKDLDARNFLTNIYLHFLNSRSRIPVVQLKSTDLAESYMVSSTRLNDSYLSYDERLTLLTDRELLNLMNFAKKKKLGKVFEFGIGRGGSLLHFYNNTSQEVKIVSFDVSVEAVPPFIRNKVFADPRVEVIIGDSNNYDFSNHFNSCDLIFIDGGHDYREVKADTLSAFQILREGGVIIWDDYNPFYTGVFSVVNKLQSLGLRPSCIKGTSLAYLEYDPRIRQISASDL